jgi:hypothetical protein
LRRLRSPDQRHTELEENNDHVTIPAYFSYILIIREIGESKCWKDVKNEERIGEEFVILGKNLEV